jgi:hypothetical protein
VQNLDVVCWGYGWSLYVDGRGFTNVAICATNLFYLELVGGNDGPYIPYYILYLHNTFNTTAIGHVMVRRQFDPSLSFPKRLYKSRAEFGSVPYV